MNHYSRLKNVLVTEDSPDIRFILVTLLEAMNLKVMEASDGEEAIKVLRSRQIDLLITDFRMPRLDGIGLLSWCRANQIHIPVIFLSANAELLKPEQVALADCCATLMLKPFQIESLKAALGAADARTHHRDCIHLRKGPLKVNF